MHSKCQQLLNCFALYFVFCERNIKYFNILFDAMVKIYLMVTFRFRINHSEKGESEKIGIIDGGNCRKKV